MISNQRCTAINNNWQISAKITAELPDSDKHELPAILLPFNLGAEFSNIHHLLRKWRKAYPIVMEGETYNEYNDADSSSWTSLKGKQKVETLKATTLEYCIENDMDENAIFFDRLEDDLLDRPVRVFISIESSISAVKHPVILTRLEKPLKQKLDDKMQVYYVETKDTNRIRR